MVCMQELSLNFKIYQISAEALHLHEVLHISRVQRMTPLYKLPLTPLPLPELPTSAAM